MIFFHQEENSAAAVIEALPWLESCLKSLPNLDFASGDVEIESGFEVRAVEYPTARPTACEFETHRDHVDVQVCLRGCERIWLSRRSGLVEASEWDEKGDVIFYHPPEGMAESVTMRPGSVLVLFPEDAHCCGEQVGADKETLRKFVFKVPRSAWNPVR